ncbi:MAG TPA: ATP-dependent metallopeptidase FtsH/Yme1/Tma family protein [Anaerolineae bacterium]|nr:ATP-dependent metallopeptidase FtsH/Yme1/Tma family protein [Anaerolineae bacterium]
MNSQTLRNSIIYIVILAILGYFLWSSLASADRLKNEIAIKDLNTLAEQIQNGQVQSILVEGNKLVVKYTDSENIGIAYKEPNVSLTETLALLGVTQDAISKVDIQFKAPGFWSNWPLILSSVLPFVLIIGIFLFIMRQAQGAGNQAFSFGRSRARLITGDKPTVTFDDVAGAEEAKEELKEVVEFLREPEKFAALGARIPKGVLMVGPPGTGKTLMAKAVAGEAGAPFFSISGSEFVEMFVGVGASRVRDLFEQAKRNSPCIIFIDEIDAVGRHRGAGLGGSHDEREQTLNQILVEMDGFDTDTNIIIIAATNRPDILDPALLRPGRFDRQVVMDRPDVKGREAIFRIHARGKPIARDVSFEVLARLTPGYVGADIENVINEAAILAARRNKRFITMSELQEAIERVRMGPERRSRLLTPKEKEIISYHEAGHAVVNYYMKYTDPVQKVTIVPRGMAGGYVMPLPDEDAIENRSRFRDMMAFFLGGRAAEEVIFGAPTTGASNDLEQVTRLARAMVTSLGMSEKLGPLTFGQREEMVFLGREISEQRNYSEEVAELIDEEVRRLVTEAHERALKVLRDHRDKLELLAKRLMEVETVSGTEFYAMMSGRMEEAPAS